MKSCIQLLWAASVGSILLFPLSACQTSNSARDEAAVFKRAVLPSKTGGLNKDGLFWVGDVTELFRMGIIDREVAEADALPLNPLAKKPRAFYGYQLRAMESAPDPSDWNQKTLSLKGQTRNKETFAICIYPAEEDWKTLPVYIVCRWGIFKKTSDSNRPVLEWPTGEWRRNWSIVD